MATCELCGQSTDSVSKVKIEGAVLKVCSSCKDLGEEVSGGKKKKRKTRKKSQGSREENILASDYGKRVKEAREEEGISISELAEELNEKSSLISKIEKQDLKPDKSLAEKLSKRLEITLYTNPEVTDYDSPEGDSRKATLEDVANVKD